MAHQLTFGVEFQARAAVYCTRVDDLDEMRLVRAMVLDPFQHFVVHSRWVAGGAVVSNGLQVRLPQAFPLIQVRVSLLLLRHCRTEAELKSH